MTFAAVAIGVGSVAAGYMASQGAQNAAQTQANAAQYVSKQQLAAGKTASAQDLAQMQGIDSNFSPYLQMGQAGSADLANNMNALTAPFNPTMQQLANTSGYQFQLQQGLESVQNGFTAQGLGVSGAAMKGAAQYANGLASSDWQNYANNYYTGQNNAYNKMMGLTQLGAQAASAEGGLNAQLTGMANNALLGQVNQASNTQLSGAAALGAGQIGSANAYAGMANNLAGSAVYGINNYPQGATYSNPYISATPSAYGANTGLYGTSPLYGML